MTNEEVIKILKSKMDGSVDPSYEWVEAIRLAISALNDKENLEKKNEFLVDKFEDFNALKTRVNILENQMAGLLFQTSDEQKDIEIPKICEECHSQSYSNGFDAGYEAGKRDAQRYIAESNETIENKPTSCEFEEFGKCSYKETGCSDCKIKSDLRYMCHSSAWQELQALREFKEKHEKKGKWVEHEDQKWGGVWYTCSNCNQDALYDTDVYNIWRQKLSDFCPNCGARME